jgi:hypothetical protein
LWTAHNEIEAKWDYVRAWDLAWINTTAVSSPADPASYLDVNPANKHKK